jgi:hypothetical protein
LSLGGEEVVDWWAALSSDNIVIVEKGHEERAGV